MATSWIHQPQRLSLTILYVLPIARLRLLIAEFGSYILQQHEPIALDYVTFVTSENVIVYTPCCTAVPVTGLDTHLRTCHRVPPKLRRMTIPRFHLLQPLAHPFGPSESPSPLSKGFSASGRASLRSRLIEVLVAHPSSLTPCT